MHTALAFGFSLVHLLSSISQLTVVPWLTLRIRNGPVVQLLLNFPYNTHLVKIVTFLSFSKEVKSLNVFNIHIMTNLITLGGFSRAPSCSLVTSVGGVGEITPSKKTETTTTTAIMNSRFDLDGNCKQKQNFAARATNFHGTCREKNINKILIGVL